MSWFDLLVKVLPPSAMDRARQIAAEQRAAAEEKRRKAKIKGPADKKKLGKNPNTNIERKPIGARPGGIIASIIPIGTLGGVTSYINALSADGAVATGRSDVVGDNSTPDADNVTHAFRWTKPVLAADGRVVSGGIVDLGILDPGGTFSDGTDISANGLAIAGQSNLTVDQPDLTYDLDSETWGLYVVVQYSGRDVTHAVRIQNGMVDLGVISAYTLPYPSQRPPDSRATAISADGSVVVGEADIIVWRDRDTSSDDPGSYLAKLPVSMQYRYFGHAFRWAGGIVDLGTLGGVRSAAIDVSADGSVVVGDSGVDPFAVDPALDSHAFRWSGGSMTDLGTLGGTTSGASAVTPDGFIVIGGSEVGDGTSQGFIWSEEAGMFGLGTLGGSFSSADAVSDDGTIVVGLSSIPGDIATLPYRWTYPEIIDGLAAGGMVSLGTLGGSASGAVRLSANGSVAAGSCGLIGDIVSHAFRWTEATGMADLNTLLSDAGIDMTGIELNEVTAIAANGQIMGVIGNDYKDAYIVTYIDATVR
jgi:probable HAF family extracellular repeat protein